MRRAERDREQILYIREYCLRLIEANEYFGDDRAKFASCSPYQDSCALCLIQIGEAVNKLSDEFKAANMSISWHAVYGMRNHLVHGYHMFDEEIVWDAIHADVPKLLDFCQSILDS